jgi:putative ABC transport system substrate-binding protein
MAVRTDTMPFWNLGGGDETARLHQSICQLGSSSLAACGARAATSAPVIGFFHLTSLDTTRKNLAAFRRGLAETGYVENKNVTIEYRWAEGLNDRLPTLVAELVRR